MTVFPNDDQLSSLRARILPNDSDTKPSDLPDRGLVRREVYPWNRFEPDRYSSQFITLANESMSRLAPSLEVRATELVDLRSDDPASRTKQLGVFARRDLPPGARIFAESSLVAAAASADDPFCDACCAPVSEPSPAHERCPDCDSVFCSARCSEASGAYHGAVCGADVGPSARGAPAADAADALYARLLLRCLAIAAGSGRHPLEARPLALVCGDFDPAPRPPRAGDPAPADAFRGRPRTLPFSFRANVLLPVNALEKMGVDVFASPLSQTWVANTLYAKIRATASARQDERGRPAVGAVHPLWCLANHSCDPNVAWEWRDGSMTFTVRGRRVRWAGREEPAEAGIKSGEEILSHYCDIDLPVKERREWAAGALGGHCRCERCVWESHHEGYAQSGGSQ
jgi:hypothetical protein